MAASSCSAAAAPSHNLALSFAKEYDHVPFARALDSMYLTASIQAPSFESAERSSRVDIDICCCVDRSGSMAGSKLDMVKATMQFMIQQLKPTDRLSIVSFDTDVNTDIPLTLMDESGKKKAAAVIDSLKAGSSTNLSGGLLTALDLLRTRATPRDVCSLLLFTDGEANIGIQETPAILSACEGVLAAAVTPITVNTFGFGSDHNSAMLRAIAEKCNGLYYYLASKEEIAPAFGDVLGGLLSCVAQAIKLTLEAVAPVQLLKVHTNYRMESLDGGQKMTVTIPDLYSEERKDLLFAVKIPAIEAENMDWTAINARLTYVNVAWPGLGESSLTVILPRPAGDADKLPTINADIEIQRGRIESVAALERANELARQGHLEQARTAIRSQLHSMRSAEYSEASKSSAMSMGMVEDMEESLSMLATPQMYQGRGAHAMTSFSSNAMQQRGISSRSPVVASPASPSPAPVSSAGATPRWGTSAQSAMRQAASAATTPMYAPFMPPMPQQQQFNPFAPPQQQPRPQSRSRSPPSVQPPTPAPAPGGFTFQFRPSSPPSVAAAVDVNATPRVTPAQVLEAGAVAARMQQARALFASGALTAAQRDEILAQCNGIQATPAGATLPAVPAVPQAPQRRQTRQSLARAAADAAAAVESAVDSDSAPMEDEEPRS